MTSRTAFAFEVNTVAARFRKAVLFDLGNTLAAYFNRPEFPALLADGIGRAAARLRETGGGVSDAGALAQLVQAEDFEAPDFRVRPLEQRLARIFGLQGAGAEGVILDLCRRFMDPVFERAVLYADSLPVLERLRELGIRTAIVSNTPWGSPATLWREELARLGLANRVDAAVFCRDAGWRKPAAPIFQMGLERLGVSAGECLFVGDDPRWDLVGPRALGMEAILIARKGTAVARGGEPSMSTLYEVLDRIGETSHK